MARHQIIYTSCMRGIEGANDGQQVFSFDREFAGRKSDEVKALFTYQVPALEPGQIMTEELAKEMPSSFMYRYLEGANQCSLTLNTYLGRDYMGSSGRFGNHLSHAIVCDFNDLDMYPCEVYGSSCLRDHMEFEEVNNPNPPEFLPEPELEKGYVADIDSIIEFLEDEEKLDFIKKMIVALISSKTQRKRVIICDEPQNKIKWIAALHYVLPLEIAKKINFNTYDFDPELSLSRICGVIPNGSRYNCQAYISSGRHFVFDFLENRFTDIEMIDEPFIDFVDTALSFSYDSLEDFFNFVINETDYRDLDENYYSAYLLYSLFSDGFSEVTEDQFTKIAAFSDTYLKKHNLSKLLTILVDSRDTIDGLDTGYALKVLYFLLKYSDLLTPDQLAVVKQMAVVMITNPLADSTISEEGFNRIYETVASAAKTKNISIPAELMGVENRGAILGVLNANTESWKIFSIIRIISDYVKDMNMRCEELYPDHDTGKLYQSIFNSVVSADSSKGAKLITCLLDNFKVSITYLTHMALNIEGYLRKMPDSQKAIEFLWNKYCEYSSAYNSVQIDEAVGLFALYSRFDLICAVQCTKLNKVEDFEEAKAMVMRIVQKEFSYYPEYAQKYAGRVFGVYYKKFEGKFNDGSDNAVDNCKELLDLSIKYRVNGAYVDTLIDVIARSFPIGKMKLDDFNFVNKMVDYQVNVRGQYVSGYILLLEIGVYFTKMLNIKDISKAPAFFMSISGNRPARFDEDEKTRDKYFDWIIPEIMKYPLCAADYTAVYSLFNMSQDAKNEFMLYCCKESFDKYKKGQNNVVDFTEFLRFVFSAGDRDDIDLVGKFLCKLSKQKLSDLDYAVCQELADDPGARRKWDAVREVAENTNPLMNGLSGLFKKMKD